MAFPSIKTSFDISGLYLISSQELTLRTIISITMGFIERLERGSRERNELAEEARRKAEIDLAASNEAARRRAQAYFEQSAYPELLRELQSLTEIDLKTNLYRLDGRLAYHKGEGYSGRGHYFMPRTADPNDLSSLTLAYWRNEAYRSPITFLGRTVGLEDPTYVGFLIEVTPDGNLVAYGSNMFSQSYSQWGSSPKAQEEVLERVYTNPFGIEFRESSGKFEGPYEAGQ